MHAARDAASSATHRHRVRRRSRQPDRRHAGRGDAQWLHREDRSAPHLAQRLAAEPGVGAARRRRRGLLSWPAGRCGNGRCRRDHRGHDRHARGRAGRPTTRRSSRRLLAKKIGRRHAGLHQRDHAASSTRPRARVLIRNLLLAQHDGNAAIVLAGPATGVVRLLGLYRSGPQIAAKCKQLVVAAGSFPAGRARRERSRPTSPRHGSCSPSGRRRSSPSASEVGDALPYPGREHREGLCVGARPSGRRRVPRRSSRCPTTRRRRRWPRCSTPSIRTTAISSCPTRARSRARRRADAVHAGSRGQAPLPDRRPGAEGTGPGGVHRDGVCPAGATAGPGTGWSRMKHHVWAIGVASTALILAVNIKSSEQASATAAGRRQACRPRRRLRRSRRRGRPPRSRASPQPPTASGLRPPRRSRCSTTPAASATTRPTRPAVSTSPCIARSSRFTPIAIAGN